jgi:NAD+ synthase (glutamine-hydrolysing)
MENQPVSNDLNIILAQLNFHVGDIEGNCKKILENVALAKSMYAADCIAFTELALTGYPPEDLIFRAKIKDRIEKSISKILQASKDITVIVGTPWIENGSRFNAALVMRDQKIIAKYYKKILPNYGEFDEQRYFTAGTETCVFNLCGVSIGLTICEDVWVNGPVSQCRDSGAELVISINASPFHQYKHKERIDVVWKQVSGNHLPILYVNQVGGQDELVFDGYSFVMDVDKTIIVEASLCEEELLLVAYDEDRQVLAGKRPVSHKPDRLEVIYQVLLLGLKDYVNKNGFAGGLVGLSGGIDSALVLALAVDALGADRVHAVMMPSPYTSTMSLQDAELLAKNLGVKYSVIEIEPIMESFASALKELFADKARDSTEENIQARIRGMLLMALSNKFGYMVISTGNKSEMAVGYATLYGDMAGGFAPLKDVPKTMVFELSRYRNSIASVIPQRIIDRPPSAELAPDQIDEDSLPPYDVLDRILELFIEHDASRDEICSKGFDEQTVSRVIKMVFQNEYKRRQAPPGVKITKRAFGKDRRYPITSGVLKYLSDINYSSRS